jgi:predicted patatin/cPLA2 family phospholipase
MRKYPRLRAVMEQRHTAYARSRALVFEREAAGMTVVICPEKPLPIDRVTHDPAKLHETYVMGRRAGKAALPAVRAMLAGEGT